MRLHSLNLLTTSATIVLLAVLTLPALAVRAGEAAGPAPPPTPKAFAFGVYVDPWHIDDWAASVGATPTIAAKFESFSRKRDVDKFTNEAMRRGIRTVLVSWEPWKPVKAKLGVYRQSKPQPGYRNVDIAEGAQDRYIRRVARGLARFDGTVYLRYAHEMNGFWYPWSWDARNYRLAWRRVVRLFREVKATNVRFVWSANPNLFEPQAPWLRNLRLYWPGDEYVDAVGTTMINFGGSKRYDVSAFVPRLQALRKHYGKPVIIAEANTQYGGRVAWLDAFRLMLQRRPWIKAVVWSQLPSRGAAQMRQPGDLRWDIQRDPASAAVMRGIIKDGLAPRKAVRRPAPPPRGARPPATEPAPIAGQGYKLVFRDRFDTLDRAKWFRLWYENDVPKSRAFIEKGALKLVSRRSEGYPNVDLATYLLGQGRTFRHGFFQVRIRWVATKAAWPVFWLFSAAQSSHRPRSFPLTSEFDIFEGHGLDRTAFSWALHRNTSGRHGVPDATRGYDWRPVGNTAGAWHTIAGLWTKNSVSVFYDGRRVTPGPIATFRSSNQEMYPILSLWIGNGGWGDGDEDASTLDEVPVWYDDFEIWQKQSG